MVFSSYIFLLAFLPAVLIGFYALRIHRAAGASVTFLLVASFVFYAYWSLAHLALLLGSIAANFFLGRAAATLPSKPARRTAAATAIISNLLLIFIFKYLDFAGSNLGILTGNDWRFLNLLLPLGISFFTFQQIGYIIDCYATGEYECRPRNYALFVTFFPQLIAGPIVHHNHTRPQFAAITKSPVNLNCIAYGLMIFAMGLTKKSLIADPIARAIDPVWASAAAGEPVSMAMAWTAMIGYTLQIYFDFSGYCDMAIGLGLMFGIRLPINFDSPYKSKSIIEFWRRWHITLSNFLRDYVYISFGGNRGGQLFRLRNIFLTMFIGGVWHGAAWTFIIWGAIHAALITANHALRTYAPLLDRWNDLPSIVVKRGATLAFIMLAWIFFRADSTGTAIAVIAGLFGGAQNSFSLTTEIAALMIFASSLALFAPNSLQVAGYTDQLDKPLPDLKAPSTKILRPTPLAATATAIMLAAGIAVAWQPAVFIYFNF